MRGQHRGVAPFRFHPRIIPARAGPTRGVPLLGYVLPDHPRSCGANYRIADIQAHNRGSSPLVRGQLPYPRYVVLRQRIIPARAGPTMPKMLLIDLCTDHPRSCGANDSNPTEKSRLDGSSPLVRGQPPTVDTVAIPFRIIPARAGPTFHQMESYQDVPDHPRSCGANSYQRGLPVFLRGSSPLVRGQPNVPYINISALRIIPARAGPTW